MKLSEQLKEWYGMPEFQPSKVDEEILPIIEGIAQLEAENETLWDVLRLNNLDDIATMRLSTDAPR